MRCGLPPPAARISVALLRKAASCFGCSRNVNVSFVLTSAAALDEDLGLEVDVGAALNIVAYVVAVFLWREPGKRSIAGRRRTAIARALAVRRSPTRASTVAPLPLPAARRQRPGGFIRNHHGTSAAWRALQACESCRRVQRSPPRTETFAMNNLTAQRQLTR